LIQHKRGDIEERQTSRKFQKNQTWKVEERRKNKEKLKDLIF
jgi:hypothetical protein